MLTPQQVSPNEWALFTPKQRVTVRREVWHTWGARVQRYVAYDEAGVIIGSEMTLESVVRFFEPGGYISRAAWRREHADV